MDELVIYYNSISYFLVQGF